MKDKLIFFLFSFCPILLFSQLNCSALQDSLCIKACKLSVLAEKIQGHEYGQKAFDKAIQNCPTLDYAYKEKAVPYLKTGDFISWKKLIDKAVELNPEDNLGYRGWCKYQFIKDYKGAIEDIEKLESLVTYDIGYCQNGDYHLLVAKALAYKGLGKYEKSIDIIEHLLDRKDYQPLLYDYLCLGVLYLKTGKINQAIKVLNKQIKMNENLAESYYYLALAYKQKKNISKYKVNILKSKKRYEQGYFMKDHYTHPINRIFYQEIKN